MTNHEWLLETVRNAMGTPEKMAEAILHPKDLVNEDAINRLFCHPSDCCGFVDIDTDSACRKCVLKWLEEERTA